MNEERPGNLSPLDTVSVGQRTWRCPDETLLAAYVEQQLDEDGRHRVESHLADCNFCLNQVGFLLSTQASRQPAAVPGELLRRATELVAADGLASSRTSWQWGALAGATACFVAIVAVSLRKPPSTFVSPPAPAGVRVEQPVLPAPATAPTPATARAARNGQTNRFELQLLFPREGSVVPRREVEFRWEPVRGSQSYEVRLVTAEGNVIWEGRVEGTSARVPWTVELVPGQDYFVFVRAFLPAGKTLKSPAVRFKAGNGS